MILPNDCIGGGITCINNSNPRLTHLKITGNTNALFGGGIYCKNTSPALTNITLVENTASWGGAVHVENNSNPTLKNSILWNNLPIEIRLLRGDVTIEYSDIDGGKEQIDNKDSSWFDKDSVYWLNGNMDANPLFCNPANGIYTLAQNSPCIGTGKNGSLMGAQDIGCDSIFINFVKKDIGLASLFMTTGDISHISNTVIDGGNRKSVIFINSGDPVSVLYGFTITHGNAEEGGGINCHNCSPTLSDLRVIGNRAYSGGGISLQFSSAIFDVSQRCNIYLNYAGRGCDIDFFNFDEGNANIIVYADTFTVKNPIDFHAYRIDKFSIQHGKLNQLSSDFYANPLGNNDNSGMSISQPLRTLSFALSKIKADSINPRKIYLSEGEYSPHKTGEHFPLNMVDDVSLKGENSDNVILDAEGISGVLSFDSDDGIDVEDLTLTGGFRFEGGGISCDNSSPNLNRAAMVNNKAMASGGGMVCLEGSHPNLENATISGNKAESGGGIAFYGSCASLLNTILWNNSPDEIYFHELEYPRSCVEISFTDVMDSTGRIIHNNNGDVYWLEGNLNSDPFFCNSDSGIYSLAENSPCIAAGKNGFNIGALCIGCGTMDIEHERVCPPIRYELYQNHPNPFNPTTTITFQLAKSALVRLSVYDMNGRWVDTLINEIKNPGLYSIEWNAKNKGSGIYFYRIHAGDFISTRKCLLLK